VSASVVTVALIVISCFQLHIISRIRGKVDESGMLHECVRVIIFKFCTQVIIWTCLHEYRVPKSVIAEGNFRHFQYQSSTPVVAFDWQCVPYQC